ncbi:unnamed protein product (macronuclear) [Paramecium tetraurelia]|uniref:Uncharacterized protein n=1 Tax=Paramecium tetraurelia TaxID=5888 RepID=A0BLR0_PARTE|nr:uncharacterized protein GSPATT00030111001 [Paramecium tetraurelia]CAK59477.1 unnamed protein product [Paramecium tetraurelia]|eukprot:XP_001426875.1 hypothetical protein (macronuclear) [Paramecium tetraurelia strain d4-2]
MLMKPYIKQVRLQRIEDFLLSLVCLQQFQQWVRHTHDIHKAFKSQDYYANKLDYESIFHQKYLPYLSILVHDIYWVQKKTFPDILLIYKLKQEYPQFQELVESGNSRLEDVTCDLKGSIKFLKKFTNPDHLVYYYNPLSRQINDQIDVQFENDIIYMTIAFLPSQMPYEASMDFGKALRDILPHLVYSDPTKRLEESCYMNFCKMQPLHYMENSPKNFNTLMNQGELMKQKMTNNNLDRLNLIIRTKQLQLKNISQQKILLYHSHNHIFFLFNFRSPNSNSQETKDDGAQLEDSPINLNMPSNEGITKCSMINQLSIHEFKFNDYYQFSYYSIFDFYFYNPLNYYQDTFFKIIIRFKDRNVIHFIAIKEFQKLFKLSLNPPPPKDL